MSARPECNVTCSSCGFRYHEADAPKTVPHCYWCSDVWHTRECAHCSNVWHTPGCPTCEPREESR